MITSATPNPRPGTTAPTDRYAASVATLNQLYVRGRLDSALAIGEHVIREFYGGDVAAYASKGRKTHSLRRLVARPDLQIPKTTLGRYVSVYVASRSLPVAVVGRLTLRHFETLLRVTDPDQRRLIAEDTVARLQPGVADRQRTNVGDRPEGINPISLVEAKILRHLDLAARLLREAAKMGLSDELVDGLAERIARLQGVARGGERGCPTNGTLPLQFSK